MPPAPCRRGALKRRKLLAARRGMDLMLPREPPRLEVRDRRTGRRLSCRVGNRRTTPGELSLKRIRQKRHKADPKIIVTQVGIRSSVSNLRHVVGATPRLRYAFGWADLACWGWPPIHGLCADIG